MFDGRLGVGAEPVLGLEGPMKDNVVVAASGLVRLKEFVEVGRIGTNKVVTVT
jgi:hypothetical protein